MCLRAGISKAALETHEEAAASHRHTHTHRAALSVSPCAGRRGSPLLHLLGVDQLC